MKQRIINLCTLVLLLIFIGVVGCDKEEWIEVELLNNTICSEGLLTVRTYTNQEGVVRGIPEIDNTPTYIWFDDSENKIRYFLPCNLPDKYKIEGLKVLFDGNLKEEVDDSIDPNIDSQVIARVLTLTSLKVKY